MGYALKVKNCNFTIPRICHVTPVNESQQIDVTSVSIAYGEAANNKMSPTSISISPSNGNENFMFYASSSSEGLSVDPISGIIYIYSGWTTSADVTISAIATRTNSNNVSADFVLGSITINVPAYVSSGSEEDEETVTPVDDGNESGSESSEGGESESGSESSEQTILAHMSNTEDDTDSRFVYSNVYFYKYNGTWLWKFYETPNYSYSWYNISAYAGKKMTITTTTSDATLWVTGFKLEPRNNTSQNHKTFLDENWQIISQTFKKYEGEYFYHTFLRAENSNYDNSITFTIPATMKYILLRHVSVGVTINYSIDIWEESTTT